MTDLSYKNDNDQDERLNPVELQKQEQRAAFDNEFNDDRMAQDGKSGDLSGGKKEPSLEQQEDKATPSWATNLTPNGGKSQIKGLTASRIKKFSPLGILLLLLGVGGIGISSLAPALILQQVKSVFSSLNKSDSALNIRARSILKFKADGSNDKITSTEIDGTCGEECKLGTVSDSFVDKMNSEGFHVATDESAGISGRNVIESITFPSNDGEKAVTVQTGDEFISAMDADPIKAAAFAKVINLSDAFELNTEFESILTGLHLDKGPQTSGDTEKEIAASENTELGQDETPSETGTTDLDEASNDLGSERATPLIDSADIGDKLSGKQNLLGATCGAYDIEKGIILANKVAKQSAFIAFAWTFLNAADQEKYGDGTPQLATQLGNQLTSSDTNKTTTDSNGNTIANPYYGESATDSAGYKEAAYNDNPGTLTEPQQKFSLSPIGALGLLGMLTTILVGKAGGVRTTVLQGACSQATQDTVTVATCATDAGVASVIPGIGTAAAAALCVVSNLAAPQIIGTALSPVLKSFIEKLAEYGLPKIASTTIGGEAGDAIFAGSASLFNDTGEAYGMSAATSSSAVSSFAVDTTTIQNQEANIARVQAQSTPFDVYNQYSFLGSIAHSINFGAFSSSSIGSTFSVIASIIPDSFATLFNQTNAATTPQTDAQKEAALYANTCSDPSLQSIGAVCDSFSQPTMVMNSNELGMDISTNLSYMLPTYADPTTGDPVPGTDYAEWVTNCAQRSTPLGETSTSISAPITTNLASIPDQYDWAVGAYCLDGASGTGAPSQNELDNFRVYWMDNLVSQTTDNP